MFNIHCFDPSPVDFDFLEANISASPFAIAAHNTGCSEASGTLTVHELEDIRAGSYISTPGEAITPSFKGRENQVQVIQLDVLGSGLPLFASDLAIVKIDAEGFQEEVINGARVLSGPDQAYSTLNSTLGY